VAIETALGALNHLLVSPPLPDDELDKIAWSVSRYQPAGDVEVTWEEPDSDVPDLKALFADYESPWDKMRAHPE
jgi:hypothetical protein